MTVSVDVLKLTQTEGVVAIRETGTTPATGTITLATTLLKGTETQSSPTANIKSITWSLAAGASATITRNSKVLWTLVESGQLDFNGWTDDDENASDIAVDITGGAGTVVVIARKISGYGSQQHQNAPLDTPALGGGSLG